MISQIICDNTIIGSYVLQDWNAGPESTDWSLRKVFR